MEETLTPEALQAQVVHEVARNLQRVLSCKWMYHKPWPKQMQLLVDTDRETLYGGAAGGGKSDALLMACLMYVDHPRFRGLLIRKTYADLNLSDALIPRSQEWLSATAAHWNDNDKVWTFPSGATITFGYLHHARAKYRYQGAAFNIIGFDELTQFDKTDWEYLKTRNRHRWEDRHDLPSRMIAGANPGGIGHEWVYNRFVAPGSKYTFIKALLRDNPSIDQEDYARTLRETDPILCKQLLEGLWITDSRGKPYLADWWRDGHNRYDINDPGLKALVTQRYISWDTASKDKDHNAYTAYVVFDLMPDYTVLVRKVGKTRILGSMVPDHILHVAEQWVFDRKLTGIVIEDRDSGVIAIQALKQRAGLILANGTPDWISGMIYGFNPGSKTYGGDKLTVRPQRAALHCKRGMVKLPYPDVACPWLADFERDLYSFPEMEFKDTADAFGQGLIFLRKILATGWQAKEQRAIKAEPI